MLLLFTFWHIPIGIATVNQLSLSHVVWQIFSLDTLGNKPCFFVADRAVRYTREGQKSTHNQKYLEMAHAFTFSHLVIGDVEVPIF